MLALVVLISVQHITPVLADGAVGTLPYAKSIVGGASVNSTKAKKPSPQITGVYNCRSGVDIRWKKVTNCVGYKIYRVRASEGMKLVARINNAKTTRFYDRNIRDNCWGRVYHYYVSALFKEKGKIVEGPKSSRKALKRLGPVKATSAAADNSGRIKLSWKRGLGSAKSCVYEVSYARSNSDLCNRRGTYKRVYFDSCFKTIKDLDQKYTYYIRVRSWEYYTDSVTKKKTKIWSLYGDIVKVNMKKKPAPSSNGSSSWHSATDFSDTLMIGDSVMALSQNTIMSFMPNVHIDAVSGRESEIGGPSENYDVTCGIFDKMRNVNPYLYTNYVIGCGNNDYYGIGAGALEGALSRIMTNKRMPAFSLSQNT